MTIPMQIMSLKAKSGIKAQENEAKMEGMGGMEESMEWENLVNARNGRIEGMEGMEGMACLN
jgi:hypothetical protein